MAQPTQQSTQVPGMVNDDEFKQIMQGVTPKYAPTKPQSAYDWYVSATAPKPAPTHSDPNASFGQRVNQDVAIRGTNVLNTLDKKNQSDFSTGYQIGGQGLGLVNDVAHEAVKSVPGAEGAMNLAKGATAEGAKHVFAPVFSQLYDALPAEAKQKGSALVSTLWDKIKGSMGEDYTAFEKAHPEAAANLQATIEAGKFAGGVTAVKQLIDLAPVNPIKSAKDAAAKVGEVAGNLTTKVPPEEAALSKIQETISPKPTVKEARLAQSEGRLIKGKEPTLFKSGTADEVLPSGKTVQSAQTIQKSIPDAHLMDESQLHTALDNKISETAKGLQPEMQKVPINKEVTGKAFDSWEKAKESQANQAEFIDNQAGNEKLQSQFETRLNNLKWDIQDTATGKMKSPTSKTLDDVWQARKEYDASVPDNVKQANSMSDAKLQFRKQMWLENRGILNNVIHDASSGLGETSRQAFSDMHDMYNAKEGILSKAKIVTTEKPSKLARFAKEHPVISAGAIGSATAATGIPGKVIKTLTGF